MVEFSTMTVDFLDTPIQRWVAIVENPSTNLVFSDVFFEIEIWDTSEDVLQSTVKSTQFMLPKQQMILTGTLEPTAAVASIDINTTWDETYVDSPEALDQWYVTDVVYSDRGTLGWGFKGKLLSSFDRRYLNVEVQVVMRDSSGEIVWASLADVSSISAHDPERWEAPTVIDVPHDSFDTFVMP